MWQQQTAYWKQLSANTVKILEETRVMCWESVRRGEGGGGKEVAESHIGSNGPQYDGLETGDACVDK